MYIVLTYRKDDGCSAEILKELLKRGANINYGIRDEVNGELKDNALLMASKIEEIGIDVLRILQKCSKNDNWLDPDVQDARGNTPMHYASLLNNLAFVDFLVNDL